MASHATGVGEAGVGRRFSTPAVLGPSSLDWLRWLLRGNAVRDRVSLAMTAAVHVDSAPQGACVLTDGTERGWTPDFVVAPDAAASRSRRGTFSARSSSRRLPSRYFDLTSAAAAPPRRARARCRPIRVRRRDVASAAARRSRHCHGFALAHDNQVLGRGPCRAACPGAGGPDDDVVSHRQRAARLTLRCVRRSS
jgi:hypothetical protein